MCLKLVDSHQPSVPSPQEHYDRKHYLYHAAITHFAFAARRSFPGLEQASWATQSYSLCFQATISKTSKLSTLQSLRHSQTAPWETKPETLYNGCRYKAEETKPLPFPSHCNSKELSVPTCLENPFLIGLLFNFFF